MIIRMYYSKIGRHVHCRLFTGKATNMTFAKSGDLVFREEEWDDIQDMLHSAITFIKEDHVFRATSPPDDTQYSPKQHPDSIGE